MIGYFEHTMKLLSEAIEDYSSALNAAPGSFFIEPKVEISWDWSRGMKGHNTLRKEVEASVKNNWKILEEQALQRLRYRVIELAQDLDLEEPITRHLKQLEQCND